MVIEVMALRFAAALLALGGCDPAPVVGPPQRRLADAGTLAPIVPTPSAARVPVASSSIAVADEPGTYAPPREPGGQVVKLTWEVGPLRRLRRFVYRNDVELVVHVDPVVRFRLPDLEYCWMMVPEPAPIRDSVQILSCYNAGGGDYVAVARDPRPFLPGDRFLVERYALAEEGEGPTNLREVGSFVTPPDVGFRSEITWPHGRGVQVPDDE